MICCEKCMYWGADWFGGWGVCKNDMTAQSVQHWKYQESMTFKTFGCVYGKEKVVRKRKESKS
jgi:capsule polysaccharide export protein KpsC/LpsZ